MKTIVCHSVGVCTYPDYAHHAAGVAVGGAVGEKQVVHAVGAPASAVDGLRLEAGGDELAAIRLHQVNVQGGADGRVGNGGLIDLVEELASVGELGLEAG